MNNFEDFNEKTVTEGFAEAQALCPQVTFDEYCATLSCSDTGNAERLELRYGDTIRYVPSKQAGTWVAFNGTHWEREDLAALALVKRTVKQIPFECEFVPADLGGEPKAEAKWIAERMKFANRSLGARAMDDALKVARINLRARETDFDTKSELLNTPSGTISLLDGQVYPNSAEDMLTGKTNAALRTNASCVEWEQFIGDICTNERGERDLEKEHYLKVVLGYLLRGNNPEHLLFFFTGDERNGDRNGRNGKSALMNVIRHVLGDDYCFTFEPEMLIRQNGKDPESKHRHRLLGRRIAYCAEFKSSDYMCSTTMKRLVGEERFDGRYLMNDSFVANMTATLVVLSNAIPQMSSQEKAAVWDKIRRVRFLNFFWNGQGAKPQGHYKMIDKGLEGRLKAERDGILAWLIEGAVEYEQNGLPDYADAIASLDELRRDADPLQDFIDACLVRDDTQRMTAKDVYETYVRYSLGNALDPISQTAFGRAIGAKQIQSLKAGTVWRLGIRPSVVGYAYANEFDPTAALHFVAKSAAGTVFKGEEMSSEMLACVPSKPEPGMTFFGPDGEAMHIIVGGQCIQTEPSNVVVPLRRNGRR